MVQSNMSRYQTRVCQIGTKMPRGPFRRIPVHARLLNRRYGMVGWRTGGKFMLDTVERFNSIYGEWRKFVRGVEVDCAIVSPQVLDSWERCKSKGVNPYLSSIPVVLEGKAREDLLEANEELIEVSRPFMEHLYGFVKGS